MQNNNSQHQRNKLYIMNNQETVFFFDDPRVLYGPHFSNLFPRKNDTIITRFNASMRFVIVVTLLLSGILRRVAIIALIPLVGCFMGIYLHPVITPSSQTQVMEQPITSIKSQTPIVVENRAPTKDNPFMNYQLDQITDNPLQPDGFIANNKASRIDMEKQFQLGVVDNENDLWGRKFASYHFYTIPNNSATPDPNGAFQNWLYGRNYPTCKEDPRFCDVKPVRTIDGGDGVMDRSLPFSIGLDANTNRRIAKGDMRSLKQIKAA